MTTDLPEDPTLDLDLDDFEPFLRELLIREGEGETLTLEVGPFTALILAGCLQHATQNPAMLTSARRAVRNLYSQLFWPVLNYAGDSSSHRPPDPPASPETLARVIAGLRRL